ncbi:enediyne antibiotic chromoprotein [Saccharothrix hoggarensis]|uniref:Enediyne antibiotic chromoprotein n=1 Tax=Saccharothrix hoggarensis TaxID=913853 RepID=A0ABW3QSK9_9PSEU
MIGKNAARIVAGSAVVLGLLTTGGLTASAAPALTVTPSSGLADGATVQVSATGLQAGTTYDVGECAWVEAGVLACAPETFTRATANSAGSLDSPLTVRKTFTGVLFDGTTWGTVDCTTVQCSVGVSDAAGNGPGGVPISFA